MSNDPFARLWAHEGDYALLPCSEAGTSAGTRVSDGASRTYLASLLRRLARESSGNAIALAARSGRSAAESHDDIVELVVARITAGELALVRWDREVHTPPEVEIPWLSDLLPPLHAYAEANPSQTSPAEEPVLVRVEVGALGFVSRGVLTLPRVAAGRWHPWAALVACARHLAGETGRRMVLLGHTEPDEPAEHAVRRCAALRHLVLGDRSAWLDIAAKWGRVCDTQSFLCALRFNRDWPIEAPTVTDLADEASMRAVIQFQREYNSRRSPVILEDGIIGEQTLAAIFEVARDDLRLWLEVNGLRLEDLAAAFDVASVLAVASRFKPYRTVPPLPPHHGGRFVDLVIYEEDRPPPALGATPAGAGIYDVPAIGTLSLDDVDTPRSDAVLELELLDDDGHPVADVECEVRAPGGMVWKGPTDIRGRARFEGLPGGPTEVLFPGARKPWMLQKTVEL